MSITATACSQPTAPTATSGLSGLVVRGPITPVCRVGVPCDAPFSAEFTAEQNGRAIASFRSGDDGRFSVSLAAGVYRIVPAADAPLMFPKSQAKTVEVKPAVFTEVRLEFDTGIR